ncbi:hypothetical protein [Adhaeretor mobilis]|uniref:Uncharacterized protein n=1 Tax=Adhaeretor mobilis TaxID=1930276 RepID=A0A517N036_9BACT|nr:hypothetical protein [Adhaeretor mobilis]QDT00493.1 hypothetical protein HG15A2_38310 [Adhaeretor mobilis]
MLGLLISAGVLGLIISLMEEGDFPGWTPMIICVLAALVPSTLINAFIPAGLFFIGLIVGAVCCGVAISATCGMTVQRACIAAGVFFVFQIALGFALAAFM